MIFTNTVIYFLILWSGNTAEFLKRIACPSIHGKIKHHTQYN